MMYLLEQFHLVQFYLFSAQTLRFSPSAAIVAPNGSGKSAVLDAMQIVLHGGDQHQIDLNAQSGGGKKGGRSIREYCLGFYSDDERARDHAATYLTMVFRDSTGKQPVVSVGIALGASVNEPKHRVYGHYLARGVELSLEDHLEFVENEGVPLEWSVFRESLKDRARGGASVSLSPDIRNASDFVEKLLFSLRAENARGVDPEAFSKALKNALNLKDVTDASAFVRERIIESRPIQVREFRSQLDSFRQLKHKVAEVEERIGRTQETLDVCKKAIRTRMHKAAYTAMAAEFRRDQHMEKMDLAEERSESADRALELAKAQVTKTQADQERARAQLIELTTQARNNPEFNKHRDHDAERESRLGPLKKNLAAELRKIVEAYRQGAQRDAGDRSWALLAKPWESLLERIAAASVSASLQVAPAEQVAGLQGTLHRTQELLESFKQRAASDQAEYERTRHRFKTVTQSLERARQGKSELPDSVKQVRRFLEEKGIEATPVCDLVKVSDPNWAPAIEAYLRSNVTALLVEPGREDEAIEIYAGIPEGFNPFGVKIVKPQRHATDMAAMPAKALAHLIDGEDPRAVDFLRSKLRRLVQLDKASIKGEDGLTAKGMLVSNGTIERLRLPAVEEVVLGGRDQRVQAERFALEKRRLSERLSEQERVAQRSKALLETTVALTVLSASLENLERWLGDHARQEQELDVQQRLSMIADNPDLIALQQLIESANSEFNATQAQSSEANRQLGEAQATAREANAQFAKLASEVDQFVQAAVIASKAAYVDAGWLDEKRSELEAEFDSHEELIATCERRISKLTEDYGKEESDVRSSVVQYANHYRFELTSSPSDLDGVNKMLSDELRRLQESELTSYKQQAEEAYGTAVRTFRSRIAASLNSSFDDMAAQLRELNSLLGRLPAFTNDERYHFKSMVAPDHKPLYDFIRRVAEQIGGEDDIFSDPVHAPEQFRELLEESDTASQALLEDYRRFFSFEVEVRRNGEKISTLGARMDKGSGGEHRAPLFVVAGAALAAAYGKMHGDKEGLSLILFDELGDKIDGNNTRAVFEYLKSLGLQPIVAAPDDALGKINESVQSYVELYRDGDYLSVQHVGLGPDANELLGSDNYLKHPELIAAEALRIAQERGAQA